MSQSLVNYYAEDGLLQQWGYLNLNNYVMVGDPSDSIIADSYAFGARQFHTRDALADMVKQATTVNDVRPGEALEQKYGYLPEDGSYGCCDPHGQVPTLLEYDTEDFATAQMARALGDTTDATMLQNRANNWVNVFDSASDLLNPRDENGAFVTGISPTTTSHYVEGDAYEYLFNVPNDYAGLFSLLGGNAKVVPELQQYLSEPDGFGMFAQLTNEFDFGEQNALDYAGDPAGTQQAVNNIRNGMYLPGPSGLANNDDLGANSSTFIWEMLGHVPGELRQRQAGVRQPRLPARGHPPAPGHDDHQQRPRRLADPLLRGLADGSTGPSTASSTCSSPPWPAAPRWTGRWAPRPPPGAARRRTPRRPTARCSRTPPRSARRVWTSSPARRPRPRCRCPR